MDDMQIVDLYFQRDEQAIEQTRSKYGAYCQRIARNILSIPEDAEECLSDTWHALWTRIPPERPNSLRAFCGRIVRNLSISRFRANRAAKRYSGMEILLSELDDCVPDANSVEETAERMQLTEIINQWLRTLPEHDRRVFILRYWYGTSVQELAAALDRTPNLLSQQLFRLRRQLKTVLEAKGVSL